MSPSEPPLNPILSDSLRKMVRKKAKGKALSLLYQANVLLNETCRLFYAQAHSIQADVVIIGISPGKACIILMISHSAILGVLYNSSASSYESPCSS